VLELLNVETVTMIAVSYCFL